MSMPSLAQATSTHLDSACKHIQQCRVSQDHMTKFTKTGQDGDELIRNKYRYCIHKDELVIGIGKCWAPDGLNKRFQNNAYPRVVSNLGQLVEPDGDHASDVEKLIKLMYHNATSIPVRDKLLMAFRDGNANVFPVADGADAWLELDDNPGHPNKMKFRSIIPNIYDFVTVGYANTLGWAHAHCGDTMTSVLIGGLRTVMNGDFDVYTGDLIQWYWPFERDCFESGGRRKPIVRHDPVLTVIRLREDMPPEFSFPDMQKDPATIDPHDNATRLTVDNETRLRKVYYDRQYGQRKGVEKVVPIIKPYKRDDEDPRLYDWYRVFAVALSTARPREHVDIRISRQAL